jgi:cysteine dioxygenase
MAHETDGDKSKPSAITSSVDGNLFGLLSSYADQVPLDVLREWIEMASFDRTELQRYMHFSPERYQRNLMFNGPAFQALLLCWRNGQRSPIHDHVGSHCAVKVIEGIATETVFAQAPNGMIYATGSRLLRQGLITVTADSDMHQISNLQAGDADLITLHVYSPPLLVMNSYSLVDAKVTRFLDPINERFSSGAGI